MTHQLGSIWSILLFVYLIFMLHVDFFSILIQFSVLGYICINVCTCVSVSMYYHAITLFPPKSKALDHKHIHFR